MPALARFRPLLPILVLPLLLAACSGPDLVNALVPEEGFDVVSDLAYGELPRQRYDLYLPEGAKGETPTVVFFYGGGWDSGAKEDYLFVGEAFASRGFAVAIPDYRLYPEVRYPDFLKDSAAAVARVRAELGVEGVSAGPLYLLGHSAGAYNAAMLSLDARWLGGEGLRPCATIAATAGLAGPYDFLPLRSEKLKRIFGPEERRRETQPISHVTRGAPPLLLIAGLDDSTVDPANSRRLAERLTAAGGRAETRFYENIGHIMLAGSLAAPLRDWAPTLAHIDEFLSRHRAASCKG